MAVLFQYSCIDDTVGSEGAKHAEKGDSTIYAVSIRPQNMLFEKATYTLYIPKGIKKVKGLFIHQHGCTMEGTGAPMVHDLQYQAFANKWGLAILGPDMVPHDKNCIEWCLPENGSDRALFKALEQLSKLSGHPEIAQAPWLVWGHSGGGHWTLSMLANYPERFMAAFAYSPGLNKPFGFTDEALKVPLMIRHAGKDDFNDPGAECWATAENVFKALRNNNGMVSIAHTENQNHNFSYVRLMAIPFFEAVLKQRLPLQEGGMMQEMDPDRAWLSDTSKTNTQIYKAGNAQNPLEKSWLPDSITATKYREYILTGTIKDVTPPLAPTDIQIIKWDDAGLQLSWNAEADIESGIRRFNVYLNGKSIMRYPETGVFQTFDTNGDNPIPMIAPKMELFIPKKMNRKTALIEISMTNGAGLESPKAKVAN